MLRNLNIRTRLLAGFGVVIFFVLAMGVVSLRNMAEQRTILAEFFEHPFTVTNAVRRAQVEIIKMHRGMKDVVLYAKDRREMEQTVTQIAESEKQVYQE